MAIPLSNGRVRPLYVCMHPASAEDTYSLSLHVKLVRILGLQKGIVGA
jgi:hypothetical protein